MDQCSGKRGAGGFVTRRKGYAAFKDAATEEDPNAKFCNRIGCHGRIKYSQNAKGWVSEQTKTSKSSSRASNGKEITGKSPRSSSVIISAKNSNFESKRKLSSPSKIDPSASSASGKSETPEFGELTRTETGSSNVFSNVRPQKIFHHNSSVQNQNTLPASGVPLASRSTYKNMKCNSVSSNIPAHSSSLESEPLGKSKMKKRSSEGESSMSRRVSKTNAASHASTSTSGISISSSSRWSISSGEDNSRAASGFPRRSTNENTKTKLSSQQNGRNSSSVGGSSSSDSKKSSFSHEESSSAASVRTRRSMNDNSRLRLSSRQHGRNSLSIRQPNIGVPQVPESPYNIDGIAEVLLALERVEHDELTHEQLLALETSLYLSSLNIYDQHRDMRMDIDNMSYEELLALEERMGTVSTALSEETLSNCLKKSTYPPTPLKSLQTTRSCEDVDDIKCSICQEEYVSGDEIGKLVKCQHGYHITCINQWLGMKNWCPICKTPAGPSSRSS